MVSPSTFPGKGDTMPTESVTGIGGKDVSADDPSLGGEYQGHPGLDEKEGNAYIQQVRDRLKNLEDMYGPDKARGMLNQREKDAIREDDLVEFVSDRGVHYAGRVVKVGRRLVVEMHDRRRVSTRIENPTLKKLK